MNIYDYVVVTKEGYDISEIEKELNTSGGSSTIPEREVETSEAREGNQRSTIFSLNQNEVDSLRKDSRIYSVNLKSGYTLKKSTYPFKHSKGLYVDYTLDIAQKTDLRNKGLAVQAPFTIPALRSKYDAPSSGRDTLNPWGFGDGTYVTEGGTTLTSDEFQSLTNSDQSDAYVYEYDGTGVDIVIIDGGIVADHPEWESREGIPRLKQIDWFAETGISGTMPNDFYTDTDPNWAGHGTHVASTAAGKKHGWAKGADIYFFNLNKIDLYTIFDLLLAWHNQKTDGRPTIINTSFTASAIATGGPNKITYRGTEYTTPYGDASTSTFNPDTGFDRGSLFQGSMSYDGRMAWINMWRVYLNEFARLSYQAPAYQQGIGPWYNIYTGWNGDLGTGSEISNFVLPDGTSQHQSLNDEMEVLIQAGIHVVHAAGNDNTSHCVEHPEHYEGMEWGGDPSANWNNKVTYYYKDNVWTNDLTDYDVVKEYYYSRPSPPYSPNAIHVGAVEYSSDANIYVEGVNLNTGATTYKSSARQYFPTHFSNFGSAIDIWGLGEKVVSATASSPKQGATFDYEKNLDVYPEMQGYKAQALNGTSMASPQVAGIAALYLQIDNTLTPAQLKKKLVSEGNKPDNAKCGLPNRRRLHRTSGDQASVTEFMSPKEQLDYEINLVNSTPARAFDFNSYTAHNQNPISTFNPDFIRNQERYPLQVTDPWQMEFAYDGQRVFDKELKVGTRSLAIAPKSGSGRLLIQTMDGNQRDTSKNTVLASSSLFDNASITVDSIYDARTYVTLRIKNPDGTSNPVTGLPIKFRATTGTIQEAGVHFLDNGNPINETIVDNGDGSYTIYFEPLADGTLTTIKAFVGNHEFSTSFTYGIGVAVVNFTSTNQAPELSENISDGALVYTATSDWGAIYELGSAGDSSLFSISTVNGEGLVTINQSPDYATKSQYTFEVLARSSAGSSPTSIIVSLDIYDATAPVVAFTLNPAANVSSFITSSNISASSASIDILETITPFLRIGSFSIQDASSYSVEVLGAAPTELLFSNTGSLFVNTVGFDFETKPTLEITIRATDIRGNYTDFPVTINVEYVDTAAPIFDLGSSTSVSAKEGETIVGQSIYTCEVNEDVTFTLYPDSNSPYNSSYSLVPDPSDNSKCTIELTSALNTDVLALDTFVIRATDAAGNFADQSVSVNVTVAQPVITSPDSFTMAENTGSGQVVYTATGTDVSYWYLGTTTGIKTVNPMWSFNTQTGELTFLDDADFDVEDEYTFVFRAHGISSGANAVYKTVTLTVTDAEEPSLVTLNVTGTHAERTYNHDAVNKTLDINITTGNLSQSGSLADFRFYDATDTIFSHNYTGDDIFFDETIYSSTQNKFYIKASNTNNGGAVNDRDLFQTAGTTTFTITLSDGVGNSVDYTININVTVLDIDAPVLTSHSNQYYYIDVITENVVYSGRTSTTFTADESVTWAIRKVGQSSWSNSITFSQDQNITLSLDSTTGVLSIDGSANYEKNSSIPFQLRMTDQSGNGRTESKAVTVIDVADTGPIVVNDDVTFIVMYDVNEATSSGTLGTGFYTNTTTNVTWTVNAHGLTGESGNAPLTLNVQTTGGESRCFPVVNDALDYEAVGAVPQQITLTCTDNRFTGNNSTDYVFYIRAINQDDEAPLFTVLNNNIQYNAPLAANSTLLDVSTLVSDPDGSISNPFTYSITSTMPVGGYYSIDSSTGVITNGYTLSGTGAGVPITVKVTDAAGNHSSYTFTTEGLASSLHTATVTKGVYSQSNGSANYYGFHYAGGNGSMTNGTFHNNAAIRFIGSFRYQSYTPTIRFNLAGGHSPNNSLFSTMTINVGGTDYTFNRSAAGYANYYGQETQFSWTSSTATAAHTAISGLSDGQTFTVEWN